MNDQPENQFDFWLGLWNCTWGENGKGSNLVKRILDGKVIQVRGYIIPTEGYKSHTEFIFSAFPYSMCFFCGGAGPETVMEVTTKTPVKFTAEAIILNGTLRLNADDINRLMYFLEDAEQVETP